MGFWDQLMGRRKPAAPTLDALFAIPGAAISLQVDLDFVPTGRGAVAFRAPEGRAFADVAAEVQALLDVDGGPPITVTTDSYNYTWVEVRTDPPDITAVVTDLHAVHSTLVDHGFGPQLLCSLVSFTDPAGTPLALVYLLKAGTIYPFAPSGGSSASGSESGAGIGAAGGSRDNVLELRVRDLLARELPIEPNLTRWFALWGAPGM